jgi:hypothetical protein
MTSHPTYDSPHTVTLTVQDWLGIRTQLAFAAFNNDRGRPHQHRNIHRSPMDHSQTGRPIMNDHNVETTLHAATIALLAEGVAVTLFIGTLLLWAAILGQP